MGNYSGRFARVGESLKGVAVKSLFFVFSPANLRRFERICSSSTQSAPLLYKLAGGTAQSCPPPAPHRVFSHPLLNRMPSGERAPVALCGTSFCSRLGRCLALPTGGSTWGGRRDKVLLPLPQNQRKHWGFAGFLFACVVWGWDAFRAGFPRLVFCCSQPSSSPPAPETHPVSPFSGFARNELSRAF